MDPVLFWTLLVLLPPFFSFAFNGIVIPWRRGGKPAAYLSIATILASLAASIKLFLLIRANPGPHYISWIWIPGVHLPSIKLAIFIDPLSSIMLFVVSLVASMVQIYSLGYMSEETPGSLGRYFTYHSLFAFSMLSLVASGSLISTYIFWELVGLCSYLLIGFWYYKPSAAKAAVKAFWVTRFGDVGFAIGLAILWGRVGTFELPKIFNLVNNGQLAGGFLLLVTLLIFAGAVGKSAQFPLHVWLPDAMEGPTPVSALIHAATMVAAGVYLVARVFPLFEASHITLLVIAYIGSFTAFFAATMALVQEDIKRVLAYSTISQLGYMMAALGAGSSIAAFFHLFTHAYFKALLFLAAGSAIHALGTNSIWEMGNLYKKMPQTVTLFIIGALSLSGIPPFAGFFSKDEILMVVYKSGLWIPFIFTILTVFLTAFYMFRVIFVAFFGKRQAEGHLHEIPVMTIPMWILGFFAIFAGFPHKIFSEILGAHVAEGGAAFLPLLSLGLALLGIISAWAIYQKESPSPDSVRTSFKPFYVTFQRKYWMDDFYEALYHYVMLGLATICGWFDRYIVDGVVNFVTWLSKQLSLILRMLQTGKVQDYLYGILLGLLILALWGYWIGIS